MKSRSASAKPITTLVSPVISMGKAGHQGSTPGALMTGQEPKQLVEVGSVDIDDLVVELEQQSPDNSDAIAQGRQWVAQTFYAQGTSMAQLRLGKGWPQAELARRAETSQSYIARLEQGQVDPQLSTVQKIAAALGVPVEVLVQALLQGTES